MNNKEAIFGALSTILILIGHNYFPQITNETLIPMFFALLFGYSIVHIKEKESKKEEIKDGRLDSLG